MRKKCSTPECGWKERCQFYKDRTRHDGLTQYCKSCVLGRSKIRYNKNPDKYASKSHIYYRKIKLEAMSHYGGVCQCCSEDRLDFLTLDHINQDGAEHRRKMDFNHTGTGFNFYLWLRKSNWPDLGLQVLCHNCNGARGSNGVCPHLLERTFSDGLGI
jgi:hypothetical protein